MALTDEEKERRRKDPRVGYIMERVCRYNSGKPYVFISYKSDEWEKVLGDIVYKLIKDFGLNVYFDGDFNGHNPHWTEQFPENMEADDCRGVLAFVDNSYTTSYATLMELLYSQVGCQESEPPYKFIKKPVVTINLEALEVSHDKGDTGLGTACFEDGKANIHWQAEKELFDELFSKAKNPGIIKNTVRPYNKAKGKLSKELCSAMFKEILACIGANENYIGAGSTLEDIVSIIKDECGPDVFASADPVIINEEKNGAEEIIGQDDNSKLNVGTKEETSTQKIKIISDGFVFHIKGRDGAYDAFYRRNGDKYTILAGSKLRYHEKWTPQKIWEQYKEKITNEGILLCDVDNLPISTAAKLIEGTSTSGKELNSNGCPIAEGESYEVLFDSSKTVADTGIIINQEKGASEFLDGYHYTIFGKSFSAGSREQYKLLYDAFRELTNRYPNSAEDLTQRKSVAKKNSVKDPGTDHADPIYFRGYDEFEVNGQKYLVGSSLSLKDKIKEIKGMFDICDADVSEFVLNGKPLEGTRKSDKHLGSYDSENLIDSPFEEFNGFEYALWGISHTSNKLSDMMHDVFDLIAEKYPGKIPELAASDSVSSVARKDDVDGKKLPVNKLNYFRASREHNVAGTTYYVGTSYNRFQGIGQIERMLKICEGSAEGFIITSSPETMSHKGGNTGKKGIDELL